VVAMPARQACLAATLGSTDASAIAARSIVARLVIVDPASFTSTSNGAQRYHNV
jgi:hypothetical protein